MKISDTTRTSMNIDEQHDNSRTSMDKMTIDGNQQTSMEIEEIYIYIIYKTLI